MKKEEKRQSAQIEYILSYKKIKNINLRIRKDLTVAVSMPMGVPKKVADEFVQQKQQWILQAQKHMKQQQQKQQQEVIPNEQECMKIFEQADKEIWNLFCDDLKGKKPLIQAKYMESRWGVCYPAQYKIVLNTRLASKPFAAVEYVLLHEYTHFFCPNHQKEFWALVEKRMPDWKIRRNLLKQS